VWSLRGRKQRWAAVVATRRRLRRGRLDGLGLRRALALIHLGPHGPAESLTLVELGQVAVAVAERVAAADSGEGESDDSDWHTSHAQAWGAAVRAHPAVAQRWLEEATQRALQALEMSSHVLRAAIQGIQQPRLPRKLATKLQQRLGSAQRVLVKRQTLRRGEEHRRYLSSAGVASGLARSPRHWYVMSELSTSTGMLGDLPPEGARRAAKAVIALRQLLPRAAQLSQTSMSHLRLTPEVAASALDCISELLAALELKLQPYVDDPSYWRTIIAQCALQSTGSEQVRAAERLFQAAPCLWGSFGRDHTGSSARCCTPAVSLKIVAKGGRRCGRHG
jgi:hypothetical protein